MARILAQATIRHLVLATAAAVALTGCVTDKPLFGPKDSAADPSDASAAATDSADAPATVATTRSVRLVDRDVEAPEVFQVTDEALWDGRPSLGGVWVASPDATDPERVILRNPGNGKFVIGALFRRERDNPGPKLQISSDAAEALGMLAGQSAALSVTALRREEAPVTGPDASNPILDAAETVATETVATETVVAQTTAAGATDPISTAGAAIDRAEGKPETVATPAAPVPAAPAAAQPAPGGKRIQIGIFSVEANAKRTADTLGKSGITAEVRKEQAQGKPFWSVIATGDTAVLGKVKGLGFKDAYFLK